MKVRKLVEIPEGNRSAIVRTIAEFFHVDESMVKLEKSAQVSAKQASAPFFSRIWVARVQVEVTYPKATGTYAVIIMPKLGMKILKVEVVDHRFQMPLPGQVA